MAKYIHDHEHHLKLSHKSIPTYMYKLGHHYDWLMLANAAWENISTPVLHKPKTFTTFDIFLSRRKKKKDDSDVATGVKYGVASFSSWSKSICNLEIDFSRIRGLPKTTASPLEGEHLERASTPISPKHKPRLRSHMVGWNDLVRPNTPTMIDGWDHRW